MMNKRWLYVIAVMSLTIFLSSCKNNEQAIDYNNMQVTEVSETIVTPVIEAEMSEEKNLVYCSTFQLAWNELIATMIKDDIKIENAPAYVDNLNKSIGSKEDISEEFYVAKAGYVNNNIIEEINQELSRKFDGEVTLDYKPIREDDIIAYGYLSKVLSFNKEFESLKQPLFFQVSDEVSKPVNAFGITKYNDEKHAELGQQVEIIDYKDYNDFIIKLKTDSNDDMVLAVIQPKDTLLNTITSVEERIELGNSQQLMKNDTLRIPKLLFNISHSYDDLVGKNLQNKHFEEYRVEQALQDILFALDEKGAVLKSKFKLTATKSASIGKELIFNKPFLIYLKEKDAEYPYFGIWVNNTELMINQE